MQKIKTLTEIGIIKPSRVLAIFPHPDDETGFAGGFLQNCVGIGADLRVICVTKGDKGTAILKDISGEALAELRVGEFKNVMKLFGVKNYDVADFPDGGLEDCYSDISDYITKELDVFNPDIVLTLEPCGIYGHPDHIALSRAVTDAVAKTKCKLIYATIRADKAVLFNRVRKEMAKEPDKIIPIEPTIELSLSAVEVKRKIEAFKSHKSQFKPTMMFFIKWFHRSLLTYEYFHIL